jgi:hypothetical protein
MQWRVAAVQGGLCACEKAREWSHATFSPNPDRFVMELVDDRVVDILRRQSPADRLHRGDLWTGEATWVSRRIHAQLGREVPVTDEVFTPIGVLRRAMHVLEGCEWFVAGSIAAMAYGEPRSTQNINIVVRRSERLRIEINSLLGVSGAAPGDKACVVQSTMPACAGRHVCIENVASGLWLVLAWARDSAFDNQCFARVRRLEVSSDFTLPLASPEDVVLRKLSAFRRGESNMHLRDIGAIMRVSDELLDREYLARWTEELGVGELWRRCKQQIGW